MESQRHSGIKYLKPEANGRYNSTVIVAVLSLRCPLSLFGFQITESNHLPFVSPTKSRNKGNRLDRSIKQIQRVVRNSIYYQFEPNTNSGF